MTRAGLVLLVLAVLSGGCASATPDPGAGLSPDQIAQCDRRARALTRAGVGDAPLTNSTYSSASQGFYAPDRANFDQAQRDMLYRRCLDELRGK